MALNRKDLIAFVILLAMVLAFFFDALVLKHNLFVSADALNFLQQRLLIAENFNRREIPLWTAQNGALIDQLKFGLFYPVHLLFLLSAKAGFLQGIMIAHYVFAAIVSYLFVKRLEVRALAALLSAAAFVLASPMVSLLAHPRTLTGIVWLPLVLLFFHFSIKRKDFRLAALAGLFAAIQFLSGDLWSFTVSMTLVLLWWGLFSGVRKNPEQLKYLAMLALVGTSVTLIQSLPWILRRVVHHPLSIGFVTGEQGLPPWRLLELLCPNLFGIGFIKNSFWVSVLYNPGQGPWFGGLCIGILPLVLAPMAWLLPAEPVRRRQILFFSIVLAGSLALALRWERFFLPAVFALSVLAGLGLEQFLSFCSEWEEHQARSQRRLLYYVYGILTLGCVMGTLWFVALLRQSAFGAWLVQITEQEGNPPYEGVLRAGLTGACLLLACGFLLLKRMKIHGEELFFAVLVVTILVWELFQASAPLKLFQESASPTVVAQSKAVQSPEVFYDWAANTPQGTPRSVTVEHGASTTNGLHYQLRTTQRALLVLHHPYDRAWNVRVNGEQGALIVVDQNSSGIFLPDRGQQNVDLEFRPWPYRLGKVATFVTLVALAVFLLHPFTFRTLLRAFSLGGLQRE